MSQTEATMISRHTFIKGELHLEGPTVISGRVEGMIVSQDALEISVDGIVEGDIQGVLVDIQGTVKGNVLATRACRLGTTARVAGELRAANLAIAEGACFVGQVHVGGGNVDEESVSDALAGAQTVAGTINRLESLAVETEELAQTAAAVASAGQPAMAMPTGPTVRVVPQAVQQTLNRSPKIIKAR